MGNEIQIKGPQNVLRELTSDPKDRKATPITTGVLDYFPLALAMVAKVSHAGNEQHNPGQPLGWNRTKSSDHADCVTRHLIQRGTVDTDGMRHTAKLAWRALALLQEELEKEAGFDPNAPASPIRDISCVCRGKGSRFGNCLCGKVMTK